jgi:alpha,alpha-trehalase
VADVEEAVDSILARSEGLRRTEGKKVFELRPDIDWDKGKAVLWLLDALGFDDEDVMPLYIGDDVTDEDAFRALKGMGLSILVGDPSQTTQADYRLEDPDAVGCLMERLADLLRERGR